uniref:Uncharacterized protein n=1 Tax=Alexandrium andersonii TaxID=327968 RepID=A0A7S2FB98_9DINO|mmetsp:Transcript_2153/g.4788  ORF Transcript_2153/g.4788 Transcript_2153/m.4788 type:complete len:280 (+) Transcript_2153:60-899(+)
MVGQRLKGYIQSCGLEASDVPKVVASFVAAKYATWGAFVVLGVRYQPLRCLVRPRQQQQSWRLPPLIVAAWDHAKQRFGGPLRRSVGQRSASKASPPARRRWRESIFRRNFVKAKGAFDRAKSSSWYGWVSDKYWYLSDKLAANASSSHLWSGVSSTLRVNPGNLALGFAEGTILYKLTFLLTAPPELWLIVKLFQKQRAMAAAEAPGRPVEATSADAAEPSGRLVEAEAPGRSAVVPAREPEESEGLEETHIGFLAHVIPWMERVLAATRDIEELSHH